VVAGGQEDLMEDVSDLAIIVDDQDVPARLHVHGTLCGDGVAATWFFPALLAAYIASSAARNSSSAVPASSSGRLATPKLAVAALPWEKGYFETTSRMRSAYRRAPAFEVSTSNTANSSPPWRETTLIPRECFMRIWAISRSVSSPTV